MGFVWIGGALAAAVGAVVGGVVTWMLLGSMAGSVADTVDVSRRALTAVGETGRVVDGVFDDVADSLRDVQATLADTSLTLTRASIVTRELGDVVSEDVPASLESVRASLPGLIDTVRVVDRTMRGLAFFGVDYDPDIPLDESLIEIDRRLGELPGLLRSQQGTLADVAADLGTFSTSSLEISDDLAAIRLRLAEASVVLAGYDGIVMDTTVVLDGLAGDVEGAVRLLRVAVIVGALGVVATQAVPLTAGLAVVRRPGARRT